MKTINEVLFLNPKELIDRWKGSVCIGTLANWRGKNYGPKHILIGSKVLYSIDEVEKWENSKK